MALQDRWNKKTKALKKAESSFKKGLLLLQEKLYKQAAIELKIALDLNSPVVLEELESLFAKYQSSEEIETALTVGLVIFQVKKDENLALLLGNYSRKIGEYKQANNLYRQTLKINRNNKLAFYNLAASMGKVNWYDDEIIKLIKQYFLVSTYILPEYINNNETIKRTTGNLKQEYLKSKKNRLKELEFAIQKKLSEGDEKTANQLLIELDSLINASEKVDYATIKTALQTRLQRELSQKPDQDKQAELHVDIFNFGLFALRQKDIDSAFDNFLLLKSKEAAIEDLELCLAIASALNGHREEAISILTDKLRIDPQNRLLNINLALLHKIQGNKLLAIKYQIISASLLEKSGGLIHRGDMIFRADNYFRQGQLDSALKLYKIVAYEKQDINSWLKIGEIHLLKKRQLEALDAFKQIKRIHPDSPVVQEKIIEVHYHICKQADELFSQSKLSQAAVIYERALKLIRLPETINRLISVYKQLNKHIMVQSLYEELQDLTIGKRAEGKYERRQEFIDQGKEQLKKQDFDSAILSFENAFSIKPDKDTFVYLAQMYKALNRKLMLKDLVERWNTYENQRAASKNQPHD